MIFRLNGTLIKDLRTSALAPEKGFDGEI